MKDQSSFRKNDNKIVCILWSGGFPDFTANFGSIRGFWPQNQGGRLDTLREILKATHFVCEVFLMYTSFRRSFIEIREMAYITPAWSSHELSLNKKKTFLRMLRFRLSLN